MLSPQGLLDVARDWHASIDVDPAKQVCGGASTAYYALFHLLIRSAVKTQVGLTDGCPPPNR